MLTARGIVDPIKRADMYRNIEALVLKSSPIIPLLYLSVDRVYQPGVQGINISALGAHTNGAPSNLVKGSAYSEMKANIKKKRFEIGSSGNPRFIPLSYRLIFTTSCMLILILGILTVVLGYVQGQTIRKQLEKRGLSIAQSLAAASMADLLTYNYIALERLANQAALDPDVNRVIYHDKEGRVAGFSGRPDLQNKFLDDEIKSNRSVFN